MPANLTPQYHEAEERFKRAATREEKIEALEEMLSIIPKHKGTEKLQADLKKRLSKIRKDTSAKTSSAGSQPLHHIERHGAGRVVVCGPPNAGKSELTSRLSGVELEVAPYPFTTRLPFPAMMAYEDIQIQLVDTPPLAPETLEPWQLAMIEQSDVAVLLFDVNDPALLDQTEYVVGQFEERGISIDADQPKILALGNKTDLPEGRDNFSAWQELFQEVCPARPFSALSPADLAGLREELFTALHIVRVYTKAPGHKPEDNPTPYVLRKGSTVLDAAASIHKDLAERFRFARVWGAARFDGQMVERDYQVQDRDLIEVHGG